MYIICILINMIKYVYHEAYLMVVACMYTYIYINICLAAGGLKHVQTGLLHCLAMPFSSQGAEVH